MKCGECLYFSDERCRRFPPIPTQYGDAIFPKVNADNFCGEFYAVEKLAETSEETLLTVPEQMIETVTVTKTKKGKKKNA